uniref:Tetratricopeptide repeat protein n=1 Tax=Strongyloides papillosus TaxID=174720 RepID=A0A0N5BLY6_STREA
MGHQVMTIFWLVNSKRDKAEELLSFKEKLDDLGWEYVKKFGEILYISCNSTDHLRRKRYVKEKVRISPNDNFEILVSKNVVDKSINIVRDRIYETLKYDQSRVSKDFDKLSQILWSGLTRLFEKGELSSGEDLTYLYVDSLKDGKIPCDQNILANFIYLLKAVPKTVAANCLDDKNIDNRNKMIGNFINYTKVVAQTETEKHRGMEDAFITLGKQLAEEGNYVSAENQFMIGNDGKEVADMLLKITKGDTTLEYEKYLLRAIFRLLCMKKVQVASVVLKTYMTSHVLFNQQKPAYAS